jgi:hypothetical protein
LWSRRYAGDLRLVQLGRQIGRRITRNLLGAARLADGNWPGWTFQRPGGGFVLFAAGYQPVQALAWLGIFEALIFRRCGRWFLFVHEILSSSQVSHDLRRWS